MEGPLIYATGSNFEFKDSLFTNITNQDLLNPLISMSSGIISFVNTSFEKLGSNVYSPLIKLTSNTMSIVNSNIRDFDKCLFRMTGGNYKFSNLNIRDGPNELKLVT